MKQLSTLFLLLLFIAGMKAQQNQIIRCGTAVPSAAWDATFNTLVENYKQQQEQNRLNNPTGIQTATYTIPVIVHVIHGGEAVGTYPNISQTQINSQIQVLNADFAGTGYNVGNVPSVFSSLVSNTGIQFAMALRDTNGNTLAEPGIDRINYTTRGWTNPSTYNTSNAISTNFDATIKPQSIWDPTKYFNIWISDEASLSLLEYAVFPTGTGMTGISGSTGTATTDGIWVYSKAFGSQTIDATGTYLAPFNEGRSATHSTGHWLGLRHTWGDGTCATDYCNDTPPQQTSNFGCQTHPYHVGTCSGNTTGEMFMNFLDYSDDACVYMFTPDQTTRMQTAMSTCPYRNLLGTHGLQNPLAGPISSFTMVPSTCEGSVEPVTNQSINATSWFWDANPMVSFSSTSVQNPTVTFAAPGTYTIILVAGDGSTTDTSSQVITVNPLPVITQVADMTVCKGETVPPTGLPTTPSGPGITYAWINSNPNIGLPPSGGSNVSSFVSSSSSSSPEIATISCVASLNGCVGPVMNFSITVLSDCVWPGDANSDGLADNNDILELGMQFGNTGTARTAQDNTWSGHQAMDWGTNTVSTGANLKHADCNGDGAIGLDDTLAVNLNYASTHTLRLAASNHTNTIFDMYFVPVQPTIVAGQPYAIDVYLGQSSSPLTNFYGAAFTLNYIASNGYQPGSLEFSIDDNTWVGSTTTNAIRLAKTSEANNKSYGAICRTDHNTTSGSGKIGTIRFIASMPAVSGTDSVDVFVNNAYVIDANGNQTPVASETFHIMIDPSPVSLRDLNAASNISVYPNPSKGSFVISNLDPKAGYALQIKDLLGRTVYSEHVTNAGNQKVISLDKTAGIYLLEMESGGQRSVHKLIIE